MSNIDRLLQIMARLRDPDGGCPWDLEQSFASIAPFTIEEAYEVADAISRDNLIDLRDELGDLLFQVVFHARLAEEAGQFSFADVVDSVCDKMERRHPHVFGDAKIAGSKDQLRAWEAHKAAERVQGSEAVDGSALAGLSTGLPAAMRARKLQQRAALVGFDWPDTDAVFDKLDEEIAEVRAEMVASPNRDAVEDEIGDLAFVVVNLARHANVDLETCLRRANAKFERRFRTMEQLAEANRLLLADLDLAAQDRLWDQAKAKER